MPTYDYKCNDCDHYFELFQPMSTEPIKVCPKCDGSVKRLIGAGSGPIFKGSGFYHTDYKSGKKNDAVKPSSPAISDGKESTAAPAKTEKKKESE